MFNILWTSANPVEGIQLAAPEPRGYPTDCVKEFSSVLISAETDNELSVDISYLSVSCLATSGHLNTGNSQSGNRIICPMSPHSTLNIRHKNYYILHCTTEYVYLFDLFKANCVLFSVITLQAGEADKSKYCTTLLCTPLNSAELETNVHIWATRCPESKPDIFL